jgi:hypothetical protein
VTGRHRLGADIRPSTIGQDLACLLTIGDVAERRAAIDRRLAMAGLPGVDWSSPGPGRCPGCGHEYGAGCDCQCCYDDHAEAITDA